MLHAKGGNWSAVAWHYMAKPAGVVAYCEEVDVSVLHQFSIKLEGAVLQIHTIEPLSDQSASECISMLYGGDKG